MRLADVDKVKEEIKSWAISINNPDFYVVEDADYIIDNAPTIDPSSLVKRGRWIDMVLPEEKRWAWDCVVKCSECDHSYTDNRFRYCPNCGALMED